MTTSLQEKSNYDKESSFFSELSSSIKYASILDTELNRRLAHEFNIFDFLRDDEIGLSRIIAHLLNPLASHGQGTFFLQHFLEFATNKTNWNHLASHTINVETEHSTYQGRRIDIYVEILGEKPFLLAIENKPYAGDQENQVLDYLKYLEGKATDFLLIYLSSHGEGPSESSFPKGSRNRWKEKFSVMAYAESGDDLDESQDTEEEQSDDWYEEEIQEVKSLATWLKICKEKCEVDRLRWFLSDAENFCTKTFGNSKSTDDVEVQIVESFLFENPRYMKTAYAVKEAWPNVAKEVAELYFQYLTDTIRNNFVGREDLQVSINSSFEGDGYISLLLYSEKWNQYDNPNTKFYDAEGRYCIIFGNDVKNKIDWWFVGVRSPKQRQQMEQDEQDRFNKIKEKLNQEFSGLKGGDYDYPGYKYVDSEKRFWERNLELLLDETKQKGGDFSDYYVNFFGEFADKAICILDEIEKRP